MIKATLIIFLCLGLGLLGFCYWGIYTAAGRAAFPEMDGLYPFYAGGLGGAIVLLAGLIQLSRVWRQRRGAR